MTPTRWIALALALAACDDAAPPPPPSSRCASCHRPEHARHHGADNRDAPPTCAVCHDERAWHQTTVRHLWPLTGAHADASCGACHGGPSPLFEGTPATCVACHRADYERAREPSHARFATTCADCHTTAAWSPTRDDDATTPDAGAPPRDAAAPTAPTRPRAPTRAPTPTPPANEPAHPEARFPIARGNHRNITCRRCHDQGGAMGRENTDCVQCHARARFDGVHDGVRQYPQGAAAPNFCVRCHTRGTRSRR